MKTREESAAPERGPASDSHRGTRRYHGRRPVSSASSETELTVHQVIAAVRRSIPLETIVLPDEFFPAHLPVALVEAVFRFRLGSGQRPPPTAERYCRHFGIARTRTGLWEMPRIDEQETLAEMIAHYAELGVDAMANEVFHGRGCFPGTTTSRAEYVLHVANELRRIGIDVLQDVQVRRTRRIDEALRPLPGADEHFVRMLLTYSGDDDLVLGGDRVRGFVARAIDQSTVSAARAVNLVRQSAYQLILSPRFLDYKIWRYGVSCGAFPPAETGYRTGIDTGGATRNSVDRIDPDR